MKKLMKYFQKKKNQCLFLLQNLFCMAKVKFVQDGEYVVASHVKYYCQFASAGLAKDILEKKIKASDDPDWKSFGFDKVEDYEFWAWRACAVICVKMVIETIGGCCVSVKELVEKGMKYGGYKTYDEQGNFVDKGWFYVPLLRLAEEYGVWGKLYPYLTCAMICVELMKGRFIVASVNPEVIRLDKDFVENNRGGHLVLVYGFKLRGGRCEGFYINNPSGKIELTQCNAYIPSGVFRNAFAGRGFALWGDR